ncbi:hypothetical protein PAPYR_2879 [Paratrimastix pyriformis]|uniref:CUB domain-containing protein n=1 Tax=Paratrimastix pyriformis TaxID=342808 RepID=A0ABQ8UNB6_9EUKA|nr:hypothetical protein PAPYR_2879 [Paratrimastix pyriformis]
MLTFLLFLLGCLAQTFPTCSGVKKIRGLDEGSFGSGDGPFEPNCLWEIQPGFALSDPQRLVIGFNDWIHSGDFNLTVYDGVPGNGILLYTMQSKDPAPREVRARYHTLATVIFQPSRGSTGGFEAYWYTSALCNSTRVVLNKTNGLLTSGKGPYKNSQKCYWTVAPPLPKGTHLEFDLRDLDTHADDCYVRIDDENGVRVAQYWGTARPGGPIRCPTSSCDVYWHTGVVDPWNTFTGFSMEYSVVSDLDSDDFQVPRSDYHERVHHGLRP